MEVDFSKLSRDYRVNPLKRGETIPKQDLEYFYCKIQYYYNLGFQV